MSGNGGVLHKARCPICGNEEMTEGPTVCLPEAANPVGGRQLNVDPVICRNCGFVSLLLAKEQPGTQH
jgi:predicted Zn-ribbon and HTH transcriptional regulator